MTRGVDSTESWLVTTAALVISSIVLGGAFIVAVALKLIADDMGGLRSIPSAAVALTMVGTGVGGLGMGWLAERIGIRTTVLIGTAMVAIGLVLSASGGVWSLWIGHGLFVGLLGAGAINAPLFVYVTKWFERRRGTGLALIASGQYVAGALWPSVFERLITAYGWRSTMMIFAGVIVVLVVPITIFLRPPPPAPEPTVSARTSGGQRNTVLGLPPNLVFALLALAAFMCCVPMAMPQQHLIALCGDLGMTAATGAKMLSVLLICAFLSRQFWGWLSDRIGGIPTLVISSVSQALAITGFLFTQDETGLFLVAAIFGLGFAGFIPAYVLTLRQVFPAREASWRVPTLLMFGMGGMATGSWLAGRLYDYFGFYMPAFASGLAFNLANFIILGFLFLMARRTGSMKPVAIAA